MLSLKTFSVCLLSQRPELTLPEKMLETLVHLTYSHSINANIRQMLLCWPTWLPKAIWTESWSNWMIDSRSNCKQWWNNFWHAKDNNKPLVATLGNEKDSDIGNEEVIVQVDYFPKWVEVEPLTKVINFLVQNIICRYQILLQIVSDNGLRMDREFTKLCRQYGIKKDFLTVAHPYANKQVEVVPKILKTLVKKWLQKAMGAWTDQLPLALWAFHATYKTATAHTSFVLFTAQKLWFPSKLQSHFISLSIMILMKIRSYWTCCRTLIEEKRDEAASKTTAS